jgi:transposase
LSIHSRYWYSIGIVSATSQPATKSTAAATSNPTDLLEELKKQLAGSLLTAISDQFSNFQNTVTSYQNQLQYAELKIRVLEERLRQQRIAKYGPGSEKLSAEQLELLELEPGVSRGEVEAESQRESLTSSRKPRRKHPGRQTLPGDLPRVEKIVACTPEQCRCGGCGAETTVIGYEESEQLDVDPAKYFVLVTKREKRACKQCEERGVVAAPLPERIIEKSLVSDQVVIDTMVAKYCDSLPLYRQSVMLQRDLGIDISRGTMVGWVMHVGELLTPIVGVMRRELLRGSYIQADETPVEVQMHDGRGQNHQAYLWQYGTPGGDVVFDFRLGRGREGPRQFLQQFEGILQTDGYAAYDHIGGPKIVHAGCWAHARRKFIDAVKLNPKDQAATRIVKLMNDLFGIDAEAREKNMDHAARHGSRLEKAPALLDEIRAQILAAQKNALPQSATGKAASYTLALWSKLTRFLEYPELELSNNLAENSMRPIAVGRKNWIHIGSPQAGPKVAAIQSVVESCRRMKIPVREYLAAVLPGLNNLSIHRVAELTPKAWAAKHNQPAA